MKIPTRSHRLQTDVHLTVFAEDKGYLEHGSSLYRLEGTKFNAVAERLWPLLKARPEHLDEARLRSAGLTREEISDVLNELERRGMLIDKSTLEPKRAPRTRMFGDTGLIKKLTPVLENLGVEVTDSTSDSDFVVLAVRSLLDPATTEYQKEVLQSGADYIFVGLESAERAFIGPLGRRGILGPCIGCLRTRLISNSRHSTLRQEYVEQLHTHGGSALLHEPSPELVASISAWIVRRAQNALQTAVEEYSPTSLVLIESARLDTTHHVLLPVPTCEICRLRQAESEARETTGIAAAVDRTVGIVHSVSVNTASSGPVIHLSGTTSADSKVIRRTMRAVNNGGAGYDRQTALNSAIGESLERYAAGIYHSDKLQLSSWNELDHEAVDPLEFSRFDDVQLDSEGFPFVRFDRDTPIRWVPSLRWSDKATVWVPASQVYLPYRRCKGEALIGQSISTGMAAGASFAEAVRAGLYEVIERDALAISWLHRLPPRQFDREAIAASEKLKNQLSARMDWDVKFHDITLDLTPRTVVAVMTMNQNGKETMSFGSACRGTPEQAAEKAFLEAAQGLSYIRRLLPSYEHWHPGHNFENVEDFNHHAVLYTKFPSLRPKAGYIIHPTAPVEPSRPKLRSEWHYQDVTEEVEAIVGEVCRTGHQVYVVDLTPPDLRILGAHAVRVLIPGFVHLAGTHRTRLLGSTRLQQLPRKLGFQTTPDNQYPHPLP